MAIGDRGKHGAPFELKSASLSAVALVLKSTDLAALAAALAAELGQAPAIFDHDPVVIDLSQIDADAPVIDFHELIALLRRQRMLPAAVRGGSAHQMEAALAAGLGAAAEGGAAGVATVRKQVAAARLEAAAASASAGGSASEHTSAPARSIELDTAHAAVTIDRPLRSGQQVYAKGGDLIVLAAVNFGAEVLADGNIHVYGPLRGKAVAGVKGNVGARIFSTCMEPELVAIAGTYRTTEMPLPAEVLGKPAQIRLDGDRLVFEPLA